MDNPLQLTTYEETETKNGKKTKKQKNTTQYVLDTTMCWTPLCANKHK